MTLIATPSFGIQYTGSSTACDGGDIAHNGGQIPLKDTHRLSGYADLGNISCWGHTTRHHKHGTLADTLIYPGVFTVLGNIYITLAATPPTIADA